MPNFLYPQSREIRQLGPDKVARLSAQRLGFQIMPERNVNAGLIEWEQKDNYLGLQQLRGLDGAPSYVKRVGAKRYMYEPGVYGEFTTVPESELVRRAGGILGDVNIDVSDLVMASQDQLINRELDLKEFIIWTLLTTGTFTITGPAGVVFTDTFSIQTQSGSAWGTAASGTPLVDFRASKLLGAGRGVNFGSNAMACMNQVTANKLLNNTNSADLGGKRVEGGNTIQDLATVNRILLANDLPVIKIYDEGYIDSSNTFQRFIPTDKTVIVGARASGELVGEYVNTRNANNAGFGAGPYDFVVDKTGNNPNQSDRKAAPNIEVHRGHNGGPVIYFPSAVIVMTTT